MDANPSEVDYLGNVPLSFLWRLDRVVGHGCTTLSAHPPAASTAAPKPPADQTPHFELKAPPPGQDLDAGLKDSTATEVPTIKVEEPKADDTPKN